MLRDDTMEMRTDIRASVQRLRQRTLVTEVRDELERMILNGEIRSGERLNEASLADQLGVSRSPVREAARSLEREGLVRTVANKGVFVRDLSLEEAAELYDLRAMIAGYLCGLAAKHADADAKTELGTFIARMDEAAACGDEQAYFGLNLEFHDYIATISGAGRAVALYSSLGKEVRLMRLRVLSGAESLALSNTEHKRIVAAIERGDADAARAEGGQHHTNGKRRLLETL
ncbi:GntR family transcriptional regulator [Maritalea mobilis]|uniref:GntR family transcriptional regulator n=1 Tax=Maritalea mobilis TaxID=483324 RepID=UPI001C974B22|nr:GntR family transcriptional regulator [Maritalea mobilis]MBY6202438.1 GntR family transcriptional regulator [Maritalea mobilis]